MRWLAMAQWFVWSIEERRMYIYMHDCIVQEELIDRRLPKHGKRRKRAASESTSSAYEWKGIDFVCLWNAGPTELYTTAHNPIRKKKKIRQTLLRVPPPVAAAPGSPPTFQLLASSRARLHATTPSLRPQPVRPAWPSAAHARQPPHSLAGKQYCCVDRLMPDGFACSSPSIHTLVTKQI